MNLVSPSILACDFSKLGKEIRSVDEAGADMIHIDVMDGKFVPNITIGIPVVKSTRKCTDKIFDVHLMIDEPIRYVDDFAKAGSDIICFHIESTDKISETINKITENGCKPAIAIKPDTPANTVLPYIDKLYMVLVMTVEPGFGGQKFMEFTMPKITEIRNKAARINPSLKIEVDGGIDANTVKIAKKAGADVFVAGSYIFNSADRKIPIEILKNTEE